MNQRDKTLWIVGDSYGTFDTTNDTHWANQFAEYKECPANIHAEVIAARKEKLANEE